MTTLLNKTTSDGEIIKQTFAFHVCKEDAAEIAPGRMTDTAQDRNGGMFVKFHCAIGYSTSSGITVNCGKHAYKLKMKHGVYRIKRTTK